MSILDQLLVQPPAFPYVGIAPGELIAAFHVLDHSTDVNEKRVMWFSRRENGKYLLVKTGEQVGGAMGRGEYVLLEKVDNDWTVVEVRSWFS